MRFIWHTYQCMTRTIPGGDALGEPLSRSGSPIELVLRTAFLGLGLAACDPMYDLDLSEECPDYKAEAVGWQERTPLRQTAEQVFAGREQSCNARLDWRPTAKQPPWGQSTLTVRVTLDRDSARVARPTGRSDDTCDTQLVIAATLEARSDDGQFVVAGPVELHNDPPGQILPVPFGFWTTVEDEAAGLHGNGVPNFQLWVKSMEDCSGTLTLNRTGEPSTIADWIAAEPN
jgi:hypothetical protein